MNAMNFRKSAVVTTFGGVAAALIVACGQGADPSSSEPSTSTSSDALTTVNTCQAEAFTCGLDAGFNPTAVLACQTGLQKCLMGLFPDAATLPKPPTLPGLDAGLPKLPTPPGLPGLDAGFPKLPTPPGLPGLDAGRIVPPVTLPDAGATDAACLADLQACLFAGTTPTTCATDAQTCLTAAAAARCDAQKKECVAAGAPASLCTAQRMACR